MTNQFNTEKLQTLFNSISEGKADEKQREVASAYLKKVFGNGLPSPEALHQFNEVVIVKAEEIYQKKASDIFSLLASYERRDKGELVQYVIPEAHKAKFVWSANGTSVEHVRVGSSRTKTMFPTRISTGAYYEIGTLAQGDVDRYNEIVNSVADAKIDAYFAKLSEVMQTAIASGAIPATNVLDASNIPLADYMKLVNVFARAGGGKPVLVADVDLIDHLAFQQASVTPYTNLLYPELQRSLVEDLHITNIGRSVAVNLVNPFITGSGNTQTVLPRNEGYIFAGGSTKPVKLVEFGAMTQYTEFDSDLEQVQIKIYQDYALDFLDGELIGYVKDDSIQP